MSPTMQFFAPCPRGLEHALAAELRGLGAPEPAELSAGVAFKGPLELGYRACLWSRVASRVLLEVARIEAGSPEELYGGAHAIDWAEHLGPRNTIAVDAACRSANIAHSGFAALKVKDAIADWFRERSGSRPSVDPRQPDVRVNLHLRGARGTVYIDLAGEALHRRHYRSSSGRAPLKENLAAGLLLLAEWPAAAAREEAFVDPMCGSGTLLIEAAEMAAGIAPGLRRQRFGFSAWRGHEEALWSKLREEALERSEAGRDALAVAVVGWDADRPAVQQARENLRRAGLEGLARIEQRDISTSQEGVAPGEQGVLVTNPPYGERIGEVEALIPLYTALGDLFKQRFAGWSCYVLSGNRELAGYIGLRARRRHVVFNGPIECRLLSYPIVAGSLRDGARKRSASEAPADAFANRLRKNMRQISKWARREGITCYRLYDADIPEYAVAVDRYEGCVHVQEYAAPKSVAPADARRRLRQILATIPPVLEVTPEAIFLKVRQRQRRRTQYDKIASSGDFREVRERGYRFLVNLRDYLDTGLFLEQRDTRALIGDLARGRQFLNLFCYTAAATVYAAGGGAARTVSVDLSNTYIDWARRNLELNDLARPEHRLIRADAVEWIKQHSSTYDLIYLNPPTFSRSKAMTGTLDIARDHVWLLRATARLLAPAGVLLFATGARRFELDSGALPELEIEDISRQMLPPDFKRTPHAHRAYRIRTRAV
jgi:23S rRNA (guanine2445-N2)-methyltransferase / 23S rRNA (guanine2069-N7)-methyltransferase